MARKRIYKYKKKYVKRVELKYFDEETKRRYRLDVELQTGNPDKIVHINMMNPSEADDKVSDHTINRAIAYVSLNNTKGVLKHVGKIVFTNLYVVYETYSDQVNKFATEHSWDFIKGKEPGGKYNNDKVIKEVQQDAQVVIIAWGQGNIEGYDDRIAEVLELLDINKLHHVRELTQDKPYKRPRHPRNWSYKWELKKYNPEEKLCQVKNS